MEHPRVVVPLIVAVVSWGLAALPIGAQEPAPPACEAAGDQQAMPLCDNVVYIRRNLHEGFGFIVGERAGQVYVVTANHVVRGSESAEGAEVITVTFFRDQGRSHRATLLGTKEKANDLAVITVPLPAGLSWHREVLAGKQPLDRGDAVRFVGRRSSWYVPAEAGSVGQVNPLTNRIDVEGLSVQPGTSGAPLVAAGGIAGMILVDDSDPCRALPIGFIEEAMRYWRHPWELEQSAPAPRGAAAASRVEPSPPPPAGPEISRTVESVSGGMEALFERLEQIRDRDPDPGSRRLAAERLRWLEPHRGRLLFADDFEPERLLVAGRSWRAERAGFEVFREDERNHAFRSSGQATALALWPAARVPGGVVVQVLFNIPEHGEVLITSPNLEIGVARQATHDGEVFLPPYGVRAGFHGPGWHFLLVTLVDRHLVVHVDERRLFETEIPGPRPSIEHLRFEMIAGEVYLDQVLVAGLDRR